MPKESQSHSATKSEVIAGWCERLGHAFGRNPKDGLVRIWQERLAHFDNGLLAKIFFHIEGHDEKFPTVSRCIEVGRIVGPPDRSPFYPEGRDSNGVPCWIDTNGDYLYAANDCPEGREFLKALEKVSGRQIQ